MLLCKIVLAGYRGAYALTALVKDGAGDEERLRLFGPWIIDDTEADVVLPRGQVLLIKEPFLQAEKAGANYLRVDSPSDLVLLDSRDPRAGIFKVDGSDAEVLRDAMQAIENSNLGAAIRAFRLLPPSVSSRKLLADALMRDERFYEAADTLRWVVQVDANEAEGWLAFGRCLYALREWQQAYDAFTRAGNSTALKKEVGRWLSHCGARLSEEREATYRWDDIIDTSISDIVHVFDVAEFHGAFEVRRIPGRGRGVFATRDLKRGDILTVTRAFSMAVPPWPGTEGIDLHDELTIPSEGLGGTLAALRVLERNPQWHKEFHDLWAGPNAAPPPPKGIVDFGRVDDCRAFNAFGPDYGICIWLLASKFNHSCQPNIFWKSYGNVHVARALRPVRSGDELRICYVYPEHTLKERRDVLRSGYGFDCDCVRCARQMGNGEPRISRRAARLHFEDELQRALRIVPHRDDLPGLQAVKRRCVLQGRLDDARAVFEQMKLTACTDYELMSILVAEVTRWPRGSTERRGALQEIVQFGYEMAGLRKKEVIVRAYDTSLGSLDEEVLNLDNESWIAPEGAGVEDSDAEETRDSEDHSVVMPEERDLRPPSTRCCC